MHHYAVRGIDVHVLIDAIVGAFHASILGGADDGRTVHVLRGSTQAILVPFLRHVYPAARFAWVAPPDNAALAPELRPKSDDPWDERRSVSELVPLMDIGDGPLRIVPIDADAMDAVALATGLGLRQDEHPRAGEREGHEGASGPALPAFPQAQQVFVLGGGRSGTSALVGALRAVGYEGEHEGHVFPLLESVLRALTAQLEPRARARATAAVVRRAVELAYAGYGDRAWLDKTPDHSMIQCVPLIRAVFPRARFVMMCRHPVGFIESRRRKFGEAPHTAALEWVQCLEAWRTQRDSIPAPAAPRARRSCSPRTTRSPPAFARSSRWRPRRAAATTSPRRPEAWPPAPARRAQDLPNARRFNLNAALYEMLGALGEFVEDTEWSTEQRGEVLRVLGTLPEELGYALRRRAAPPRKAHRRVGEVDRIVPARRRAPPRGGSARAGSRAARDSREVFAEALMSPSRRKREGVLLRLHPE